MFQLQSQKRELELPRAVESRALLEMSYVAELRVLLQLGAVAPRPRPARAGLVERLTTGHGMDQIQGQCGVQAMLCLSRRCRSPRLRTWTCHSAATVQTTEAIPEGRAGPDFHQERMPTKKRRGAKKTGDPECLVPTWDG